MIVMHELTLCTADPNGRRVLVVAQRAAATALNIKKCKTCSKNKSESL